MGFLLSRRYFSGFNPRAREERDFAVFTSSKRAFGFNPRAREERDKPGAGDGIALDVFQSTRP